MSANTHTIGFNTGWFAAGRTISAGNARGGTGTKTAARTWARLGQRHGIAGLPLRK